MRYLRCGCVLDGDEVIERCPDAERLRDATDAAFRDVIAAMMDDEEGLWTAKLRFSTAAAAELAHSCRGKLAPGYVSPIAPGAPMPASAGRD